MNQEITAPYSAPFDLGTVADRPEEIAIVPKPGDRAGIATWLEVSAVGALSASVRLSRIGDGHYLYEGRFEADVVQACVVTLDPVPSHLKGHFSREYQLAPRTPRRRQVPEPPIELSSLDEDSPEILESSILDLAAPILEELSLSLDPYPRAAGAAFEAPKEDSGRSESPFAVLEALKPKEGTDTQKPRRPGKKQSS